MAKAGIAPSLQPPHKHRKAQGLRWVKGHWSQTHVCNLGCPAAPGYNHPSPPNSRPSPPKLMLGVAIHHISHTLPFSQPFAVCQLGCSAFWEQSKAARLHLRAGWSFPNQPLRNLLHPEPQASQGLCKHLSFTALGAASSHCEVPSSLGVPGKSLTKQNTIELIIWLGAVTLLSKNECVIAFID